MNKDELIAKQQKDKDFASYYKNKIGDIKDTINEGQLQQALTDCDKLIDLVNKHDDFRNNSVYRYVSLDELMQFSLFYNTNKTDKKIVKCFFNIEEVYLLAGSICIELGLKDKANEYLLIALEYAPTSLEVYFEYIEQFKVFGDIEKFYTESKKAMKLAYKPKDIARCYRNFGYYFIEQHLFEEAYVMYTISLKFDVTSTIAEQEINFIYGNADTYSFDSLNEYKVENICKERDIPLSGDPDVLLLAYQLGIYLKNEKQYANAKYYLNIVYDMSLNKDIKAMIEEMDSNENN